MLSWIWGCMVLSFKAMLGGIFWSISIIAFVFIIAGIIAGIQSMLSK